MKTVTSSLILICVMVSGLVSGADRTRYKPLEDLIVQKKALAEFTSKGGHQEECMVMLLKNLTPDTMFIRVEPGRRLTASEAEYQDILILREEMLAVLPHQSVQREVYGFCCESSNSSPSAGLKFEAGYMAPPDWVLLAEVVSKNHFPAQAVQHAVWVLSDGHELSSVYDEDALSVKPLVEVLAHIKNIEIPWYSLVYETDTAMLFSGRPVKLYGTLDYYVNKHTAITITLRNSKGELLTVLADGLVRGPGHYELPVELDVKGWPKGTYEVYVTEDYSNLNVKKTFVLR